MPPGGPCVFCEGQIGQNEVRLKCGKCDHITSHAKCVERRFDVKARIANVTYQDIVKMGFVWLCTSCNEDIRGQRDVMVEMSKICEKVEKIESLLSPSEPTTTYASVTKNVEKAIVISSKRGKFSQMAQMVTSKLHPVNDKISDFLVLKDKCVIKTKHGDIESIAKKIEKIDKDLQVRDMRKRKPRLKIVGHEIWTNSNQINPFKMINEYIVQTLKTQNDLLRDETEINVVKILNDAKPTIIIETNVRTFHSILKAGYLFVGFYRCKVYNANTVPRCYKCSRLSHFEKHCTSNAKCCPKCAGDHKLKECKSDELKCVNCVEANSKHGKNYDVKHTAFDRNCPTLAHRQKIVQGFFEAENG